MTDNMNRRWDAVLNDPVAKNKLMRERSVGFQAGHPLSVWRCDIKVNLTDAELANKIGVSEITVANWQNGRTRPQVAYIQKLTDLATEIGVPLDLSWAGR